MNVQFLEQVSFFLLRRFVGAAGGNHHAFEFKPDLSLDIAERRLCRLQLRVARAKTLGQAAHIGRKARILVAEISERPRGRSVADENVVDVEPGHGIELRLSLDDLLLCGNQQVVERLQPLVGDLVTAHGIEIILRGKRAHLGFRRDHRLAQRRQLVDQARIDAAETVFGIHAAVLEIGCDQ
ncbi:hypothetical protein C0V73_21235 [Rhizobium sp. TH135]|uniref:hypothetical protein n=1 Tax=Rhizobium sp. TH135 TaxID=2067451 RepID=UPI000C7BD7C9|nr:hypothetical protein [Rhizobium sp. TH135]PLK68892.1 hypothetical protein C0V73_21235 [Rhizobium sp. TH135]